MFGRIAPCYDLMNTLMTAGLDRGWRRAAVRAVSPQRGGLALDVGTGTARLAAALARDSPVARVVGLDLSMTMLRAGQAWLWQHDEGSTVALVAGDALALPFPDSRFNSLMSAFTVRNLANLEAGFREQVRVVKPGASVVCLEVSWPRSPLMRAFFEVYFGRIVPLVGALIAGDRAAYSYLPASVRAFPAPEALADVMRRAGLADLRWRHLGLGTVTLHVGRKPVTSPHTRHS
jgi:demethylmenaquinone methyltransferase/2-methoxy-6-polyprenyl-1,4-benzoquinol methylase